MAQGSLGTIRHHQAFRVRSRRSSRRRSARRSSARARPPTSSTATRPTCSPSRRSRCSRTASPTRRRTSSRSRTSSSRCSSAPTTSRRRAPTSSTASSAPACARTSAPSSRSRRSMNEYLDRADWRVNANANQGYSLGGLILNVSGKVVANYWLSHVYPREVGQAHRDGDIHIHDLDMLAGYCAGWSLRTLLTEGLNGVPGKVESGPPKHLSSAVGQIVNFLGTLQNEWAGAQAFSSSFDTYMAPFVRKDSLDLRRGAPVDPGAHLQPQRPVALGHADALHEPHLRLDLPRGPRGRVPGHRRRGAGVHLRRPPGRDGPDQPRLHRGHDRGRRQGPRLHLPDPHLQHHAGLPLGVRERRRCSSR